MATILLRRGTRAEVDAAATAGELFANEPIWITDGEVFAVGTSTTTYKEVGVEANDLTAAVTWANVPDANITQSAVTQHEGALTITESQVSDLGSYVLTTGDTMTGNLTIDRSTPQIVLDESSLLWTITLSGSDAFYATTSAEHVFKIGATEVARFNSTGIKGDGSQLTGLTESQITDLSHYTSGDFDVDFGNKTTTGLTEGTNLYFTDARAKTAVDKPHVDSLGVDAATLGSQPAADYTQRDVTEDIYEQWTYGSGIEVRTGGIDLLKLLREKGTITNSGGTIVNAQGLIEEVPDNTPRFSYDANGEVFILPEEARTNGLTRSEEFDHADWFKTNATVNANAIAAPDGTLTADEVIDDATDSVHRVFAGFTQTTSSGAAGSVFAKANTVSRIALLESADSGVAIFNLANGTVVSDGTGGTARIERHANGWYRCSIAWTASDTGATLQIQLVNDAGLRVYSGSGQSVYLWGAQGEIGAAASSYIPTEGTAKTRTADDYLIDGVPFSDFWNAAEGTIVTTYKAIGDRNITDTPFSASDGTFNELLHFDEGVGARVLFISGGSSVTLTQEDVVAGELYSIATGFDAITLTASANGNPVLKNTHSLGMPAVDRLHVGARNDGQYLNSGIYRLDYYPKRLPDAEVEALSGGKNLVVGEVSTPKAGIDRQGNIYGQNFVASQFLFNVHPQAFSDVTTTGQTRTLNVLDGPIYTIEATEDFTLDAIGPSGKAGEIWFYVLVNTDSINVLAGTNVTTNAFVPTTGAQSDRTGLLRYFWDGRKLWFRGADQSTGDLRP